jgi:16S rRNA (cytosine1402-N4)-methyltransferase
MLAQLKPQGRGAIITFHSSEDKLVKDFLRDEAATCICLPSQPICNCSKQASLILHPVIKPSETEKKENPKSRSAHLWLYTKK